MLKKFGDAVSKLELENDRRSNHCTSTQAEHGHGSWSQEPPRAHALQRVLEREGESINSQSTVSGARSRQQKQRKGDHRHSPRVAGSHASHPKIPTKGKQRQR